MQVFILVCIIVGAFAANECPENSHYNSCGTACPLTCENYQNPPKACVLMCNPGCHCDEGYVKTKDGRCVQPEDCPSAADEDCPANSHYEECGTSCPVNCDNYKNPPKICVLMCNPGCHCDKGYVETKDGKCIAPKDCVYDANSCLEKPETGMCRGNFPMFYYDAREGVCKDFTYGGCGGNGNKFGTEEECLEKCSDVRVWESGSRVCNLPLETGPCFASVHKYGFDKTTGQCKKFIYGGCQGNENNFDSLEECQNACPQAKCGENKEYHECGTACPLTCDNYQNPPKVCPAMCVIGCHCKEGFVKTKDNKCVLPENCPASALDRPDCDKGFVTGPCRARMPRFYYDQEAGMCKQFIYGGCGGNRNNFETRDECYNKCGALAAPLSCQMDKEVGPCRGAFPRYFFNKESGQCEHFTFGGCLGNSNNFNSKEDCEAVCLG